MRMTMISLAAALTAATATAQVPPRPVHGAYGFDQHRHQVDRHRYEMERLTAQADVRAATARRQQIETRQTLRALEAARQPPTPYVERAAPPADPAVTGERHRRTRETVTQIDAWLDRRPD